jgi:hypothetical protein
MIITFLYIYIKNFLHLLIIRVSPVLEVFLVFIIVRYIIL